MPFAPRVVPNRADINDIYGNNAMNILQKASVSNMVGLLQQLNEISKFSAEVFGSLLQDTEKSLQRVKTAKQRLADLHAKVPAAENRLSQNAPSFFYDCPYTAKEWVRRDPLRGGFFRRDRSGLEVNRRRNQAIPPPNLSAMDRFSETGPCVKNFSDADFFVTQWLEAQTKKMEEEKRKRKARKADRKKKKAKRQETKKILKIQKTKYNAMGAEFNESGPRESEYVETKHFNVDEHPGIEISDDDPRASNAPPQKGPSPRISSGPPGHSQPGAGPPMGAPPPRGPSPGPRGPGGPPPPMVNHSSGGPGGGGGGGPPPPIPGGGGAPSSPVAAAMMAALAGGGEGGPPAPPPGAGRGGPPPPIPGGGGGPPMGGGPPPIPGGGGGGPPPQPAYNYHMEYQEPPQQPAAPRRPALPTRSMNFLSEIKGGTNLKKAEVVRRELPQDNRSKMMSALRDGTKLKKVDPNATKKKEEDPAAGNSNIFAILQRRALIADDDSDESEASGWSDEE